MSETIILLGGCAFMLLLGVIGYYSRKNRRNDSEQTLFEAVLDSIADTDTSGSSKRSRDKRK